MPINSLRFQPAHQSGVPDLERATALNSSVATPYEEAMTMGLRRRAKKFRFLKVLPSLN
jgi:hypothetical protein